MAECPGEGKGKGRLFFPGKKVAAHNFGLRFAKNRGGATVSGPEFLGTLYSLVSALKMDNEKA